MPNYKIFTFWEPKDNIPAYLKLCLKTWEKFLKDYEVIILDYSNLEQYLGTDYFDKVLYDKFSLPKQTDAIRAALLKKYGGIWLDLDTIILNQNILNLISNTIDFEMPGRNLCFVKANKDSYICTEWDKQVKERIEIYKNFYSNPLNKLLKRKLYKKIKKYDYLGNGIVDNLIKTHSNFCYNLDEIFVNAFPERRLDYNLEYLKKAHLRYQVFYFLSNLPEVAFENNCGLLCLHNSWTPIEYKLMNEEEFLSNNNTISNIFKQVLELS